MRNREKELTVTALALGVLVMVLLRRPLIVEEADTLSCGGVRMRGRRVRPAWWRSASTCPSASEPCTLLSAGMIAGEGLAGILIALLTVFA